MQKQKGLISSKLCRTYNNHTDVARQSVAWIGGHSHSLECKGFSKVQGTCRLAQRARYRAEKRMKAFPIRTLCWSRGSRPGRPKGIASLRSGGGPGLWSLARVKEQHGVPKCAPQSLPDRSHPMSLHWFFCNSRLYSTPRSMSHSKVGQPVRLQIASASRPEPLKISMKTLGSGQARINAG